MTRSQSPDVQFVVASELGKVSGQMQTMLGEVSRINGELVRQNADMDNKHRENQALIALNHKENQELLNAHKKDDDSNFKKLFTWYNRVTGMCVLIGILFAVVKWIWPLLSGIKLGE